MAQRRHCLPGGRGGLGQHRLDRGEHSERRSTEGVGALRQGAGGNGDQIALQHRGPTYPIRRDFEGNGDGVRHHSFEGSLPKIANDEIAQEPLLALGGAAEHPPEERLPHLLGAGAGYTGQFVEGLVDLEYLE